MTNQVIKDFGTHKVRGIPVPGTLLHGPMQGDSYFVDPTNGLDSNSGRTMGAAKKTLEAGEDLLVANQNDTLYYLAGSTGATLAAAGLVWDKNYTHLVGVAAPTNVAQRARIFLAAASVIPTMINISASGCSFRNFYAFHGVASTASLRCVTVSGGRNYFENVHVAGLGHSTGQADVAGASALYLNGAEENLFRDCTIGVNTISRSAANSNLELVGAAASNSFENCTFLCQTDAATPLFVECAAAGMLRYAQFTMCRFINHVENGSTTLTQAMSIDNAAGGLILLHRCMIVGAGNLNVADNGNVWVDGAGGAGTGGRGIVGTN